MYALPVDALVVDPASMDAYRWDRALDPNAGVPLAVVRPQPTEQMQETVRIAASTGIPIVPPGRGIVATNVRGLCCVKYGVTTDYVLGLTVVLAHDRDATAMPIVQSDESAAAAADEIAQVERLCLESGATEVYATDDPDEGESFVVAYRMAIPAVEKKGTLLLEDEDEDEDVPLPRLGDLVTGIAGISAAHDVPIPVIAHAGDGNTHPLIVFDPSDDRARRDHHGRARRRSAQAPVVPFVSGPGRDGAHAAHQDRHPRPPPGRDTGRAGAPVRGCSMGA